MDSLTPSLLAHWHREEGSPWTPVKSHCVICFFVVCRISSIFQVREEVSFYNVKLRYFSSLLLKCYFEEMIGVDKFLNDFAG